MLRAEDNRYLTESGAGTGMGELLRRFWLPVLLSKELPEADGPPKKIVVMGEELLAFRDSRGVVGWIGVRRRSEIGAGEILQGCVSRIGHGPLLILKQGN